MAPGSLNRIKASYWNDKMAVTKKQIMELLIGKIVLMCNKCDHDMQPGYHYDFDDFPHKRQFVCTNQECNFVDYIIV